MKQLHKSATIMAKVLEVVHFLGGIVAIIFFVMSFVSQETMFGLLGGMDTQMKVYGFGLDLHTVNGAVNLTLVRIFSITALFLFLFMAMVFRNVYLIFKTAEGKTKFAKGTTPFQKDVVRMIREIGIFYIAIPIVGLIMSTIARLMLGVDAVEASMDISGFVTGFLLLCLSQIFAYGVDLQTDTDGLL